MRRHPRYPLNGKVRVSWEGANRQQNVCVAKVTDVSKEGMQLACSEPIAPQTIIQFQFVDKFFEGSASVRSCSRHGINHRIGLEFCGGLQWPTPPAESPAYTE